jgi:hypothetical protein
MNSANTTPASTTLPKRRFDPILQELYDVKAQLNKEADYSVEKVFERAWMVSSNSKANLQTN